MAGYLDRVSAHLGSAGFWKFPTLFWFSDSDTALMIVCWTGVALSVLLIAGVMPVLTLSLLWLGYLSLVTVGNIFTGYQWDILLLETGFLSIFFASWRVWVRPREISEPSRMALWLLRLLLFKLMFMSGVVKLISGDWTWRSLNALNYHYETQPLPTWLGWYAHQLPDWFQHFSVVAMFGIELVVPFLIFVPGRTRRFAGFAIIGFQLLIMLTGNYGFFNVITIALCITLFDDGLWPQWFSNKFQEHKDRIRWPRIPMLVFGVVMVALSIIPMSARFFRGDEWVRPMLQVYRWVRPYHLTSGYGLFAVMTTERDEIMIEGSNDGVEWRLYELPWKSDRPGDRPRFVQPHQPRLDWQLWFAALRSYQGAPWMRNLLYRLLEGSPDVLSLFASNPFPDGPPRYVRARVMRYHFTDLETKKQTGDWWRADGPRSFAPVLSLNRGRQP